MFLLPVLGCGAAPIAVFPEPQASVAIAGVDTRALLRRLEARDEKLRTFRALATMRYEDSRERIHLREVIVIDRPDRLRIEMMSAFGIALQITSDGEYLRAYHRGEKAFYSGRASAQNLNRFTRLPLEIHEIVDLLLGLPAHRERQGKPRLTFEEPTGLRRLSVPLADGGLQIVWFDDDRLLPVRAEEVDRDGERRYLAAWSDYRLVNGVAVPHQVELTIPSQNATVQLHYLEVTLNEPVEGSLFTFAPPQGSRMVDLDSLEAG